MEQEEYKEYRKLYDQMHYIFNCKVKDFSIEDLKNLLKLMDTIPDYVPQNYHH